MKRVFLPVVLLLVLLGGVFWYTRPTKNPDPNHSHADFAVYISGQQFDFSKPEFMSGSSTGSLADADHLKHDPYFHLHDANGHLVHRHKPGVPMGEFFQSLSFTMTKDCLTPPHRKPVCNNGTHTWAFYVNGAQRPMDPSFSFTDGDKLLWTFDANQAEVQRELAAMTDEACLYSQTCPWKGKPPTENCIADPKVPCTE